MKRDMTKAAFCNERPVKKAMPKTLLDYDMQRAEALGYGPHYGKYKADHPNTRAEFERLTETAKHAHRSEKMGTCPQCGKQFLRTGLQSRKTYCSEECRIKNNYAKHYEKKSDAGKTVACPVCGTEFVTKNQHHKYCSRFCHQERNRVRIKELREQRKKEAATNDNA